MRTAKVQMTLRIYAVSPKPSLFAHLSCRSWETFNQRTNVLDLLRCWACTLKVWPYGLPEWSFFSVVAHTIFFFIFQLCKIVWGNYVPHISIWAPSWEKPRATYKLHVRTIKVQINRTVWSKFLFFATWKLLLLRLLYAKTRGFWTEQASFCLTWSIGTPEDRFSSDEAHITKTRLFEYIENFTSKNWKFSDKNSDSFHTSAQNIDCMYSLEPPRRGGSNEYPQSIFWAEIKNTPVNLILLYKSGV